MLLIYKIGFIVGGLSLLIFCLGQLFPISSVYLTIILILLFASLAFLFLPVFRRDRLELFRVNKWHFVFFCIFIVITLPLVLLPPTARDELIVHLAVPKLYLQKGSIFEIPFMGFSYVPMNIDLLYLIPMVFGNDVLPKLIHFCFAILTALIIYTYLSKKIERDFAVFGFFIFLTTPIVIQLSTTAYIDLGLTFYSTLALIGMLKWREADFKIKWLIYSAISTGFALGSKYSALILLLFFTLTAIYFYSQATRNQLKAIQTGFLYFCVAILVFSPWLIRNYLWTGNPIYPLANGLFTSGQGMHLSSLPPLQMRNLLYGESLWYILLMPLRIFWEGKDGSHQYFDGVLNPFFLLFIPFAFIGIKDRNIKYFALFAFFFFFIAFFTVDIVIRYLLPILPVFIIFVAYGIKKSFEIRRLKPIAMIAVAGLFIFNGWYVVNLYAKYQPQKYLIGKETREQYLSRMLPDYPAVAFANSILPDNAKVMLLFTGDRGYYWEREYYYGDRMGSDIIDFVKKASNEKELRDKFKAIGITHLFVRDSLFAKFSRDNFGTDKMEIIDKFFKTQLKPMYSKNDYTLYEII
ncbi:MAG: hypothetical protein A2X87_04705 [Deltaproteobacteria bacterium GWC2_42_51]|nr:MAG: hypothetical protein A2067_08340 [Deltaproteobacteria bacterium GWB2_42_7]OGP34024.1 MAG: hypothetical protein A2X87_04705 [Deltaproteobacteria bacterium GWC2_42_51]OGP37871.1 MAG: hypothetical protein A2090_00610 [Deltaproteobacteria bacterium GWD2_42_10]OGP48021.1 MAG: hypothetical protein A2022_11375 [Deltaproteobacteria bacterium GWF2_42_12]OGQ29758.1 MAG: hypothetical protein A3D29_02675 [Deltaproteobacteria bacterium RIFCSPHIGHO2_02_FULL_42_44]OGQ38720.1 MAG: hypothetical protein